MGERGPRRERGACRDGRRPKLAASFLVAASSPPCLPAGQDRSRPCLFHARKIMGRVVNGRMWANKTRGGGDAGGTRGPTFSLTFFLHFVKWTTPFSALPSSLGPGSRHVLFTDHVPARARPRGGCPLGVSARITPLPRSTTHARGKGHEKKAGGRGLWLPGQPSLFSFSRGDNTMQNKTKDKRRRSIRPPARWG